MSCKPLKSSEFVRPTRFPRQDLPLIRTKNAEISVLFSVKGTGGSPTGPDPKSNVGEQDNGDPGMPVSFGFASAR